MTTAEMLVLGQNFEMTFGPWESEIFLVQTEVRRLRLGFPLRDQDQGNRLWAAQK